MFLTGNAWANDGKLGRAHFGVKPPKHDLSVNSSPHAGASPRFGSLCSDQIELIDVNAPGEAGRFAASLWYKELLETEFQ